MFENLSKLAIMQIIIVIMVLIISIIIKIIDTKYKNANQNKSIKASDNEKTEDETNVNGGRETNNDVSDDVSDGVSDDVNDKYVLHNDIELHSKPNNDEINYIDILQNAESNNKLGSDDNMQIQKIHLATPIGYNYKNLLYDLFVGNNSSLIIDIDDDIYRSTRNSIVVTNNMTENEYFNMFEQHFNKIMNSIMRNSNKHIIAIGNPYVFVDGKPKLIDMKSLDFNEKHYLHIANLESLKDIADKNFGLLKEICKNKNMQKLMFDNILSVNYLEKYDADEIINNIEINSNDYKNAGYAFANISVLNRLKLYCKTIDNNNYDNKQYKYGKYPVIHLTGTPGSGKSTVMRSINKSKKITRVELDLIESDVFNMEEIKKMFSTNEPVENIIKAINEKILGILSFIIFNDVNKQPIFMEGIASYRIGNRMIYYMNEMQNMIDYKFFLDTNLNEIYKQKFNRDYSPACYLLNNTAGRQKLIGGKNRINNFKGFNSNQIYMDYTVDKHHYTFQLNYTPLTAKQINQKLNLIL